MQKAVDAVSSFGVDSHIGKREQEVLQFVAQAHEDSFIEYERLHNKVALWRSREFSQIVLQLCVNRNP